jgi:hypothetical protein
MKSAIYSMYEKKKRRYIFFLPYKNSCGFNIKYTMVEITIQ